jgi:hypothetical protein
VDSNFAKLVSSLAVTTLVLGGCMNTAARIAAPADGSLADCK